MNRNQEILAMALWVEKHHGAKGSEFIAQQLERLSSDPEGQKLWQAVAKRFTELKPLIPIHGQPGTFPN